MVYTRLNKIFPLIGKSSNTAHESLPFSKTQVTQLSTLSLYPVPPKLQKYYHNDKKYPQPREIGLHLYFIDSLYWVDRETTIKKPGMDGEKLLRTSYVITHMAFLERVIFSLFLLHFVRQAAAQGCSQYSYLDSKLLLPVVCFPQLSQLV